MLYLKIDLNLWNLLFTDQSEVQAMYRESMPKLLETVPAVEKFSFLTFDSGFYWSPGLYPGQNGPSWCKSHPTSQRVQGFMQALQESAEKAGKEIEVDIHGVTATLDDRHV